MGRRIKQQINLWDKTLAEDLRDPRVFFGMRHFDVIGRKLQPKKALNSTGENTAYGITTFDEGIYSGSDYKLFGVGKNASGKINFYHTASATNQSWTKESNEVNSIYTPYYAFYYKENLYAYDGVSSSLLQFDTSDQTVNNSFLSLSHTNIAPPVHHPLDDYGYFFFDNFVYALNDETWVSGGSGSPDLTLPDNEIITCAAPFGPYLAIGTRTKYGPARSTVYLWDRDSSLTTLSAKYNWGAGKIFALAELSGVLYGLSYDDPNYALDRRLTRIKRVNGSAVQEINAIPSSVFTTNEISTAVTGSVVYAWKSDGDKIYWSVNVSPDIDNRQGIASVDSSGRVIVEVDCGAGISSIEGIYKVGEYYVIANNGDGSVDISDDADNYSFNSIIETGILGDPDQTVKLIGVTVTYEEGNSASTGSIWISYKKPEATSWTSIATDKDATSDLRLERTRLNDGSELPQLKEYMFRVETDNGAQLVSLEWVVETVADKDYE